MSTNTISSFTVFYLMLGIVLMILALSIIIATFSKKRFNTETKKWSSIWLVLFLVFLLGFYFTLDAVSSYPQLLAFGFAGVGLLMIGTMARR